MKYLLLVHQVMKIQQINELRKTNLQLQGGHSFLF